MRPVRPSSLTLFAILAFIFAGFSLLGFVGQLLVMLMTNAHHSKGGMLDHTPLWWGVITAGWSLISGAALVVGGIGLLRLSPLFGRWLLTAWAVGDIALNITGQMIIPELHAQALGTVVSMLLPALMLVWIHVICADVWQAPRIAAPRPGDDTPQVIHPIWITTVQALRQSLRGMGGPGFLLAWLFLGLGVAWAIGSFTEKIDALAEENHADSHAERVLGNAVTWAISRLTGEPIPTTAVMTSWAIDEPTTAAVWARHLIRDHAPAQSFTWMLLSIIIPFVVTLATCGAISRDVGNRGFRFLLVRTERSTVFWGRFLAPVLVVAVATAIVVVLSGVGFALAGSGDGWATARWTAWASVALVLTALPYLALGLLCSTVVGHTFGSLATCQGIIAVVLILAFSLAAIWAPLIHVIHLLPVVPQLYLFHPTPWVVVVAALVCLGYTALFLAAARAHFLRRDL